VPNDPEDNPGYLLWHVTLRWQRDIAAALAPLDLTHAQFVLLASTWWLNRHGHNPNQLTVARHAGTDVKMTSQVLRRLEAKGLILRETDRADTRAKKLHVTQRGAQLAERAVSVVEAVDEAFFKNTPDAPALTALLRPLAAGDPDAESAG
jgi:DNA-binding MarR family transcriptional regulator